MSELSIRIYGEIGFSWWGDGTTASDVATLLAEHPSVETLHVELNSPGGDLFDAVAIVAQLQRHPARVVVHVDGVAASAASVIAMAGDEIRMGEGAFIMIHEASSFIYGDAQTHRETADWLAQLNGSMADLYARRSRMSRAEVLDAMSAETWYSATQARDAGFVDAIVEGKTATACADLSRFRRVPAALRNATMSSARRSPPPTSDRMSHVRAFVALNQEKDMELSVLITALGLSADADASAVLKALTNLRGDHSDLTAKAADLTAKAAKLTDDLAARDKTIAELTAKVANLESDQRRADFDKGIAALKANARVTDGQVVVMRDLFDSGHVEQAMDLVHSYADAPQLAPVGPRQSRTDDAAGANNRAPVGADGNIDWQALIPEIPAHVRQLAGPSLSAKPRAFIEANKHTPWAKAMGINWDAVPRKA